MASTPFKECIAYSVFTSVFLHQMKMNRVRFVCDLLALITSNRHTIERRTEFIQFDLDFLRFFLCFRHFGIANTHSHTLAHHQRSIYVYSHTDANAGMYLFLSVYIKCNINERVIHVSAIVHFTSSVQGGVCACVFTHKIDREIFSKSETVSFFLSLVPLLLLLLLFNVGLFVSAATQFCQPVVVAVVVSVYSILFENAYIWSFSSLTKESHFLFICAECDRTPYRKREWVYTQFLTMFHFFITQNRKSLTNVHVWYFSVPQKIERSTEFRFFRNLSMHNS